jgi:hypothetical protein
VIPPCSYRVSPAYKCHCPGRTFPRAQEALAYARQAAEAFRVSLCVWRVQAGRSTLLWRFNPTAGAA